MSTRSTTHFVYEGETEPQAIIYRHPDGYPEGHGVDLLRFLKEIEENVLDTRFNDPSYLAARLVVWLADMFRHEYREEDYGWTTRKGYEESFGKPHLLNFISVGVVQKDPGDIEYRYVVECGGGGIPTVRCMELNTWSEEPEREVPIPGNEG